MTTTCGGCHQREAPRWGARSRRRCESRRGTCSPSAEVIFEAGWVAGPRLPARGGFFRGGFDARVVGGGDQASCPRCEDGGPLPPRAPRLESRTAEGATPLGPGCSSKQGAWTVLVLLLGPRSVLVVAPRGVQDVGRRRGAHCHTAAPRLPSRAAAHLPAPSLKLRARLVLSPG